MLKQHGVAASTTRGRLKQLELLGMISRKKNCPLLTPEKGDEAHRYKEYRINERDNLITIQPAGQAQLRRAKVVQ
jgi:Mn-dependent DtxR family transcriptional regulator